MKLEKGFIEKSKYFFLGKLRKNSGTEPMEQNIT